MTTESGATTTANVVEDVRGFAAPLYVVSLPTFYEQVTPRQEDEDQVEPSPEVHFEPVMKLETLEDIKTFEEDEESIFKMYTLRHCLLPLGFT